MLFLLVIEFEKLFLLIMDIYRRKKENMKIHLENLFFAADVIYKILL